MKLLDTETMFHQKAFIFLQLFIVAGFCYTRPDKPCQVSDQECITMIASDIFTAALNAETSPGYESIDPMHHDIVVASLPSVNFTLKDSTVNGLKDLKVQSAGVSDHNSIYITVMFTRFEMSGMYEVNGNFMNSPITGSGHYDVKGTDTVLKLINSNDKLLAAVWNPPITKANLDKIFININKVLEGVQLKELSYGIPQKN